MAASYEFPANYRPMAAGQIVAWHDSGHTVQLWDGIVGWFDAKPSDIAALRRLDRRAYVCARVIA